MKQIHVDDSGAKKKTIQSDEKVKQLEMLLQEKEEDRMRALADYDNLLRRTSEDKQRLFKMAAADIISSILEPLDNLELAANHLHDKGLSMVVAQFAMALEAHGVKEIQTVGMSFDPQTMEAVEVVEGEENKVVGVHKKGYMLNGVILRHAKVVVGKGK